MSAIIHKRKCELASLIGYTDSSNSNSNTTYIPYDLKEVYVVLNGPKGTPYKVYINI